MKQIHQQRGLVLLLIILSMLAILGTVMLAGIANSGKTERNIDVAVTQFSTASDLKQAIFGYILSAPIGSTYTRPGTLPIPDTLAFGGYDGNTDTTCLSFNAVATNGLPAAANNSEPQRCLGRWPWQVLPIELVSASRDASGALLTNDPNGAIPWLAVSANLVLSDTCLTKLNSDTLNLSFTAFSCPASSGLPHPWLTVLGASGEILTQRAAAVIIIPGKSLTVEGNYTQTRASNLAPGNPKDYLDKISIPLGCSGSCTTTIDNAGLTNRFIQLPPNSQYPSNAEDSTKKGEVPFNDIVVYITIDELMEYIERRVIAEMKKSLVDFSNTPASPSGLIGFPWAAPDVTPPALNTTVWPSTPSTLVGLFPFLPTSPTTDPIPYATNFAWNISNLQTSPSTLRVCRQVRTGPTRWANIAQNTTTNPSARAGSTTATAIWRSSTQLEFSTIAPAVVSPNFSKTFSLSTNQTNCNNGVIAGTTNSATYLVSRIVTFSTPRNLLSADCSSTPVATYLAGNNLTTQRMTWTCSRLNSPVITLPITITDTLTNSPTPVSNISYLVYPSATASVAISELRYQPVMASWFYNNSWQAQTIYGVANSSAPATTTNCASASKLTVGTRADINAVIGLTGHEGLTINPVTDRVGTRYTTTTAAQREGLNNTATNCTFADSLKKTDATYNDRLTIVSP